MCRLAALAAVVVSLAARAPEAREQGAPVTPMGQPDIPAAGVTVSWLADRFGRGEYQAFEQGLARTTNLQRLMRDVRVGGGPWRVAPHPNAVFALEMAVAGLNRLDKLTRDEAVLLLEHFVSQLRRPAVASAFECAWHGTGIAAVEGIMRPAIAVPFVRNALDRCRTEPRFHLAMAVVTDQQWPHGTAVSLHGRPVVVDPGRAHRQEVIRLYETAARFPLTAVEARVRSAWFAFRLGEVGRALELLDAAKEPVSDLQLHYMRLLIRGQVLQALGQIDAARATYLGALSAWPIAQSGRLALMALEVAHGDRSQAAALSETIQTAPPTEFDPWSLYWHGDLRLYGDRLARLRKLAR